MTEATNAAREDAATLAAEHSLPSEDADLLVGVDDPDVRRYLAGRFAETLLPPRRPTPGQGRNPNPPQTLANAFVEAMDEALGGIF
jgi:hypothetical protein